MERRTPASMSLAAMVSSWPVIRSTKGCTGASGRGLSARPFAACCPAGSSVSCLHRKEPTSASLLQSSLHARAVQSLCNLVCLKAS